MPTRTLTVVNISLHSPAWDYDRTVALAGRRFRLVRIGTGGDLAAAEDLVWRWSLKADAVAVSGASEAAAAGLFAGERDDAAKAVGTTQRVPVTNGRVLADVLQEWSLRHVQSEMPGYFTNARTVVLGGEKYARAVQVLAEFTSNIEYADPTRRTEVPAALQTIPGVSQAAGVGMMGWRRTPGLIKGIVRGPASWVSHRLAHLALRDADVVVGSFDDVLAFGVEDLSGTAVITTAITDDRLDTLRELGADLVVDTTPQPFDVPVVASTLEAMASALAGRGEPASVDDLVTLIDDASLTPRLVWPNGPRRKSRFAFVIHPLSPHYLRRVEPLSTLMDLPGMARVVERAAAYMPPLVYSRVTGVESPTGDTAEGWLITVGGTPREMLAHSPEFTYAQLLDAADLAKKLGAQLMGLGAFTKVVGDAGVTVSRQASIPITTGNSYSASGALWAAHEALRRLGLDGAGQAGGGEVKAMVVGASGAIGSVCARLLALVATEIWLVSPEPAKLLAIKQQIESEPHAARVHVATDPGDALADMDMIVTATSAAGAEVLDIMKVKPGCVITDVARPLDMSAEEVAQRPDVLVIESGEVELPGDVSMRDIGLPDGVAYACLAETIVLALEGRYETFTVGRTIEWPKVKEIYQLGLKHGMRLATISGVNGVYTDEDFTRVREAALAARAARPATEPPTPREA